MELFKALRTSELQENHSLGKNVVKRITRQNKDEQGDALLLCLHYSEAEVSPIYRAYDLQGVGHTNYKTENVA